MLRESRRGHWGHICKKFGALWLCEVCFHINDEEERNGNGEEKGERNMYKGKVYIQKRGILIIPDQQRSRIYRTGQRRGKQAPP